jgi:hypothetical protein
MCFSSTCADGGGLSQAGLPGGGGQADDRYLALVERFGDTTSSQAQVATLRLRTNVSLACERGRE